MLLLKIINLGLVTVILLHLGMFHPGLLIILL